MSCTSLARDLQRSPKTIRRWLDLLERMYIVFRVTPYHRNVARSLLKEPKSSFYDTGQVLGDAGSRLENLVAGALLKELHFLEDVLGQSCRLHYLRDKEGREVDFLVTIDERPALMVEGKWADGALSRSLPVFARYLPGVPGVQLVGELEREQSFESGLRIVRAAPWLADLDLKAYGGSVLEAATPATDL